MTLNMSNAERTGCDDPDMQRPGTVVEQRLAAPADDDQIMILSQMGDEIRQQFDTGLVFRIVQAAFPHITLIRFDEGGVIEIHFLPVLSEAIPVDKHESQKAGGPRCNLFAKGSRFSGYCYDCHPRTEIPVFLQLQEH